MSEQAQRHIPREYERAVCLHHNLLWGSIQVISCRDNEGWQGITCVLSFGAKKKYIYNARQNSRKEFVYTEK